MSGTYATPLHLEPRRSRRLGGFLLLIYAGTLPVVAGMQLSLEVTLLLAVALLAGYIHSLRRHVLRTAPAAILALVWGSGNRWQLTLNPGEVVSASLRPQVFIRPWLVILYLTTEDGRTMSVLLLPDMFEAEVFRRLRVRLLIEMKQIAAPAG